MGSGVSNASLLDLINTTKENLPDNEFEVAYPHQVYEICNRWFQRERVMIDNGTSVKRNIILDDSGNAQHVLLFQKTAVNVADVQHQLDVPWVQAQTYWSIERREALRNRAPAMFIPLVKSRQVDALISMANILEERGWQSPNSSTDKLHPYGIPYWLPALKTTAGEGFYGGSATGFTSTAAIDPATSGDNTPAIDGGEDKWRSYSAGGTGYYKEVNATLIKTLKTAWIKTNFQSPMTVQDMVKGPKSNFRLYMNAATQVDYETLAEKQNENLGRDLAPFHGVTAFRRAPVVYIDYLDADSTANPIYGVNHAYIKVFVMAGDYLRESKAMTDVENHNVGVVTSNLFENLQPVAAPSDDLEFPLAFEHRRQRLRDHLVVVGDEDLNLALSAHGCTPVQRVDINRQESAEITIAVLNIEVGGII